MGRPRLTDEQQDRRDQFRRDEAARLKDALATLGLSQSKAAQRLGWDDRSLAKLSEARQGIGVEALRTLGARLSISADYILGFADAGMIVGAPRWRADRRFEEQLLRRAYALARVDYPRKQIDAQWLFGVAVDAIRERARHYQDVHATAIAQYKALQERTDRLEEQRIEEEQRLRAVQQQLADARAQLSERSAKAKRTRPRAAPAPTKTHTHARKRRGK